MTVQIVHAPYTAGEGPYYRDWPQSPRLASHGHDGIFYFRYPRGQCRVLPTSSEGNNEWRYHIADQPRRHIPLSRALQYAHLIWLFRV